MDAIGYLLHFFLACFGSGRSFYERYIERQDFTT